MGVRLSVAVAFAAVVVAPAAGTTAGGLTPTSAEKVAIARVRLAQPSG